MAEVWIVDCVRTARGRGKKETGPGEGEPVTPPVAVTCSARTASP
jgi:hypothetical protein